MASNSKKSLPPTPRPLLLLLAAFVAALALSAIGLGMLAKLRPGVSVSAVGGPFALQTGDGRTVTDRDMLGEPFLVFFGYTHCPDVCPTTLAQISQVLTALGPDTKLKVLFITVDPERDTPKVVKDYAASFYPGMIGLTGTPEQVTAAEKAYKVYAAKARPTSDGIYTVDHSSIIYLMGTDGRFLAHFAHGATADQIADGLRKVLN